MSYKDEVKAYAQGKREICVVNDTIPEELFKDEIHDQPQIPSSSNLPKVDIPYCNPADFLR